MDVKSLIEYLLTPIAQVALVIGLAELVKRSGAPSKLIPICDLVFGLISGIVIYGLTMGYGMVNGVMLGIAIGLSACGLFSGIKNVSEWGKKE